jgi:hypothetical protein
MVRRREFVAGLGGAAVAWPFVARAQQLAMPWIVVITRRSILKFESYHAALSSL